MAHDLRTTLSPIYSDAVQKILSLLTRSISASALTALLETLSSLFRYLLVPAINFKLLEETWDMVTSILPKCLGEIQRAFAEVWGNTLRRLKAGPRERAMTLLAERVEGLEDASAWVVVFACKVGSILFLICDRFANYSLPVRLPDTPYMLSFNLHTNFVISSVYTKSCADAHAVTAVVDCAYSSCQKCRPVCLPGRCYLAIVYYRCYGSRCYQCRPSREGEKGIGRHVCALCCPARIASH